MIRKSGGRTAAAVVVVLGCLVVAGCGSTDNQGAQPNNSSTGATSSSAAPTTPTEASGTSRGRDFTADPTLVNAHPISFSTWTRVADDRIAVNFQTGTPDCYGVDVAVRETDSTVTVELRAGTRADATGRMCTMIAVFGTVEVGLRKPLGNRQVLSAV